MSLLVNELAGLIAAGATALKRALLSADQVAHDRATFQQCP